MEVSNFFKIVLDNVDDDDDSVRRRSCCCNNDDDDDVRMFRIRQHTTTGWIVRTTTSRMEDIDAKRDGRMMGRRYGRMTKTIIILHPFNSIRFNESLDISIYLYIYVPIYLSIHLSEHTSQVDDTTNKTLLSHTHTQTRTDGHNNTGRLPGYLFWVLCSE
jgi:hypothetical protein